MTEHFTRNTESVAAWCNRCGKLTDHHVRDGRMGRCVVDHTRPPKAVIPKYRPPDTIADIYEVHGMETSHNPRRSQAVADALHLQALDGPDSPHDGKGGLPARKERKR